ncbi:MAG: RNA-binding S4 domain-containing protein [Firmicutes bacterium]|nr:RNA-binding S4 domain-containing protein [Bacillota bacterium]
MRIDKFLKVSRLLKRRTVASNACSEGLVFVNGKQSKPGNRLKVGDVLSITLGDNTIKVKVLSLNEKASKAQADTLYEVIE